jgi:hypothetical protein
MNSDPPRRFAPDTLWPGLLAAGAEEYGGTIHSLMLTSTLACVGGTIHSLLACGSA